MPAKENKHNRRELLRALGRTAALFGLAAMGKMAMNPSRAALPQASCEVVIPCRECKIFESCSLPQALSFKPPSKERIHE
ncbi:MAG: hypothetical protein AB1656_14890 [Candidatus Omnitrophota bacterium]